MSISFIREKEFFPMQCYSSTASIKFPGSTSSSLPVHLASFPGHSQISSFSCGGKISMAARYNLGVAWEQG